MPLRDVQRSGTTGTLTEDPDSMSRIAVANESTAKRAFTGGEFQLLLEQPNPCIN